MDADSEQRKYCVQKLGQFLSKVSFYLRYGYVRYAVRTIPEGKQLPEIDAKLLNYYDVTYRHHVRTQRKKKGLANVIYIRFERTFILMATEGIHPAFDAIVSHTFHDTPLYFSGYAIGLRATKAHVIIEPKRFKRLRAVSNKIALHPQDRVTTYLRTLSPFRFRGVNEQRWKLFRAVNKKRKKAGLSRIRWEEVKR